MGMVLAVAFPPMAAVQFTYMPGKRIAFVLQEQLLQLDYRQGQCHSGQTAKKIGWQVQLHGHAPKNTFSIRLPASIPANAVPSPKRKDLQSNFMGYVP